MSSIARLFAARVPDLAILESMQTGRPIREMSTQLGRLSEWFEVRSGEVCREQGRALTDFARCSTLELWREQKRGRLSRFGGFCSITSAESLSACALSSPPSITLSSFPSRSSVRPPPILPKPDKRS
jgi:hypothetical protein